MLHISKQQKAEFDERGYLIVNNVFPSDDLKAFRKTLQAIVSCILQRAAQKYLHLKQASVGINCDEGLLALRYADPEYISVVQRLISRSPEFFRLSSNPKVFEIIRELMELSELSPLYLLSNGIIFTTSDDAENKRSSNIELDWHKDSFFTIPRSKYFHFWAPVLQDSTEEIGTLMLCPGSHKDGYGKQKINTDTSFNYRYCMATGEADKYAHISAHVELGQLLIFDGKMIHASGKNTSGKVRTTMIGLCHDASRKECIPVSTEYKYHGQTPEAWFYEVYHDESVKELVDLHVAVEDEPAGGV
jgi:ectoine hydroxylase-related dioxygenase (phytanoyl-CoA dioxygenase family)